jgi:hypothetical protein
MSRVDLARRGVGAALLLVLFTGCGPGRGELKGTVTYQGKPLRTGTVTVFGGDGMPRQSQIKEDGSYAIPDIQAGAIKAAVVSTDPVQNQPSQRIPGTPRPKIERGGWFPIPEKYSDVATSELSFDLQRGSNSWPIELK